MFRHITIRPVATVLTLFVVFLALAPVTTVSAFRQTDGAGLTGELSYESPQFGYRATWAGDWAAAPESTASQPGLDVLTLDGTSPALPARLQLFGVDPASDPAEILDALVRARTNESPDAEVVEEDHDGEAFSTTLSFQYLGVPALNYMEARLLSSGAAVVVVSLLAPTELINTAHMDAWASVSLDDGNLFIGTSDTGDMPTPTIEPATSPTPLSDQDQGRPGATGESVAVPMARGNPARTGALPGFGPSTTPAIRWSFETSEDIYSSPAVVDNVVYFGGNDGRLYAVDAESGHERWHVQTEGHQVSSPAVVDGVAYVGADDDFVYAVDAATGEEQWRFEAGSYVYASPAVADGTVYVGSGAGLIAIDAETGEKVWRVQGEDIVSFVDPAVADGVVYAGGDETLFAVDAGTGREVWRFEARGDIPAAPAVAGGVVYVGTEDGDFYALDAATGEERWRLPAGDIYAAAAVADDAVFFGDSDFLYAVDSQTGAERWRVEMQGGMEYSSPTVAKGVVYAADFDFLYAFDADTGAELWRREESILTSDPVAVDGVIYAADMGGTLFAFADPTSETDIQTPVVSAETPTPDIPAAPPRPSRPTATPPDAGEVYESPQYGYRLLYDSSRWQITVTDADPTDVYDTVTFSNGVGYVYLVGDPRFDPDALQSCVDTYHALVAGQEGVSDIQHRPGSDLSAPDRAASAVEYLYTPATGEPYRVVDYVECRAIEGVTLVIQHGTAARGYEDQAAAREQLLGGLEAPTER